MGNKPKIIKLYYLFDKGENFRLTDSQYEKKTGAPLPKDKYYTCNKSAIARKAREKGYKIKIIEKQIIFEKNNL